MSQRIEKFSDLLRIVKDKYADAEALSTEKYICTYGHEANGIGCAIGCVMAPEDAVKLDAGASNEAIDGIIRMPELAAIVHKYIAPDIQVADLMALQRAHDTATTVAEFRDKLDLMIEQYPEANH